MSRAAVWSLLSQDPEINELGFDPDNMYGNNVVDSEKRGGPFLVMAWGEVVRQDRVVFRDMDVQVQDLRVWVHQSKYQSNDFGLISTTLDRVKAVLVEATHIPGGDGRVLSHIDWQGDSADLTDDVLNTITRNSAFRVFHRKA